MRPKYNYKTGNGIDYRLNYIFYVGNYRVLRDLQKFEFAPITLLIGPNSSGKSSLMKLLASYKEAAGKFDNLSYAPQSIDGRYEETSHLNISEGMNDKDKPLDLYFNSTNQKYFKDLKFLFKYLPSKRGKNELELDCFSVKNAEHLLINLQKEFYYSDKGEVKFETIISINYVELIKEVGHYLTYLKEDKLNNLFMGNENTHEIDTENIFSWKNLESDSVFSELLEKEISNILADEKFKSGLIAVNTSIADLIEEQNYLLDFDKFDKGLSGFLSFFFSQMSKGIKERIHEKGIFDEFELSPFGKFMRSDFANVLQKEIYSTINSQCGFSKSPVYRTARNKYFILNENNNSSYDISLNQYIKSNLSRLKDGVICGITYVDKWLVKFGIGETLHIKSIDQSNTLFLIEVTQKEGAPINVSDLGYGAGQILSFILIPFLYHEFSIVRYFNIKDLNNEKSESNLKQNDKTNTFTQSDEICFELMPQLHVHYMEEPDTNLHPNWQSLLAELLVSHLCLNIRYVIETHSEYMVRKLQYLTAKGEIKPEDCKLFYFNNAYISKDEPKIKEINIDVNGGLSDNFGPGFYDEAINLKFDLLRLNKHQIN